jgi:hypothetical protein
MSTPVITHRAVDCFLSYCWSACEALKVRSTDIAFSAIKCPETKAPGKGGTRAPR